jgi:hypothetical protein
MRFLFAVRLWRDNFTQFQEIRFDSQAGALRSADIDLKLYLFIFNVEIDDHSFPFDRFAMDGSQGAPERGVAEYMNGQGCL